MAPVSLFTLSLSYVLWEMHFYGFKTHETYPNIQSGALQLL